jgi:hypothetical protein
MVTPTAGEPRGCFGIGKLLLTISGPVVQLLRVSHPGDSSRSQPNEREPITINSYEEDARFSVEIQKELKRCRLG